MTRPADQIAQIAALGERPCKDKITPDQGSPANPQSYKKLTKVDTLPRHRIVCFATID
jgi:hypothetical protein